MCSQCLPANICDNKASGTHEREVTQQTTLFGKMQDQLTVNPTFPLA